MGFVSRIETHQCTYWLSPTAHGKTAALGASGMMESLFLHMYFQHLQSRLDGIVYMKLVTAHHASRVK